MLKAEKVGKYGTDARLTRVQELKQADMVVPYHSYLV